MPAKRRRAKAARITVSARACEIFATRPGAVQVDANGGMILDCDLAHELGRLALIRYADLPDLVARLEAAR